ncbi:MAG: DNA polymerase/3'-5' exonuclease PolX [Candidatus Nealsonbacteria bacterium]|nr:DNA polymerase/3'-5' exonuclease PolX [Candidatus Nealsonbacteria bacterium]
MKNQELAKIFYEISDYLKTEDIPFKPYAWRRAAIGIETLKENISDIYTKGGLKSLEGIPGVGKSIAEKIEEYLKTGKIKYYEQFKRRLPFNLEEIISVEGMGPKRAKALYQRLGIKNLKDLERAAKTHKIGKITGFGEASEKNILQGIAFLKRSKGRFLLGEILPAVKEIETKLRKLKEVKRLSVAGSVRRMKETIGDVDILIIADNPKKVMDFFVSLPGVVKIWAKGSTKSSVRMEEGFDVDLRVLRERSYGAGLQYFTGSKEHNIATRRIAIEKGLKLSEYGVFRGNKTIAAKTEEDVYKALGMLYIEPELREDNGEIEAALRQAQGKLPGLPKIIEYGEIRGDLHVHSSWDGGTDSIEELARTTKEMGYEYVGISDHTKFLRIEHGLNEKQLERRNKEIDKLNWKLKIENWKFRILKGCEANIMNDGSIDIKDEALAKLDYVIAGVHSNLKMEKARMTERIIRAMKNPHLDILAHPTGRILKRRDEYQIDFDKILRVAKETGTILEIDAFPERLDLADQNIRRAKELGVKMVIDTDTHQKDQLRFMELGIAQARRGWAEKKDIINAWPLEKLLSFLKK